MVNSNSKKEFFLKDSCDRKSAGLTINYQDDIQGVQEVESTN
ncbi:hypothetical protein BCJMU51_5459 [Bacillus cereus]|nr:hypothetical protein BCM0045_5436 [Bacillus cereus]BCC03377.1 hypothetical protein BCM0057_5459 [Bacillus cereus]BCC26896.1 hypothetical protein BCM0079_5489 [Bacillus cereus]BCC38456.1 hypothetical protein BCM0105_5446 [Bacillus cereus]BCC44254.1 hypothetical protein BCJMU01_5421 [Bacillus cereus]